MIEFAGWLALAFVAGMLLNATPCVLPAVPVKLRILLNEGGQSAERRLLTGIALLAGSLTLFIGLGVLSLALQWSWGAPMGSLLFRGLLAAVLALAAGMLIFDLGRFPVSQRIANWHGRGALEGFAVGVSGGILSLSCTGPFLGGVLAFSLTQPPVMVVSLFGAIGAGMAAPYLLLLAVPAWAPHRGLSGRWGRAVNRLLGFGLLAGALFYGQALLPAALQGRNAAWLLAALLGVWAVTAWWRKLPVAERGTAALALAGAILLGLVLRQPASGDGGLDWQPITRAEARPRQIAGPALLEFTAEWCINCKVLERTVYRDPEVIRAAGRRITPWQLDLTDFDDEAQALLASWDGTGLPYAVIIDARGQVQARLRDLFSRRQLVDALQAARQSE